LRQIDRKTGIVGFGSALCEVDWLHDSPDGVIMSRVVEHNGSSVFLGLATTIHADFKLSYATWRGNFGMDDCRSAGKLYNYTPVT
jgi:hypothetical protein